ncbi:MAG: hypothetical protein AAFS00_03730, partial [Bacteroidota bacterium]
EIQKILVRKTAHKIYDYIYLLEHKGIRVTAATQYRAYYSLCRLRLHKGYLNSQGSAAFIQCLLSQKNKFK